ncbi:MAG: sugar transferase [Siphonobacter sp.]
MSNIPIPPLRILYVEEDPQMALIFLRKYGQSLNIRPVNSSEQALEVLQEHYPADALVIGYESGAITVIHAIREIPWLKYLPVIVTVDKIVPALSHEVLKAGGNDIFPKDFSQGDLLIRLYYFVRKEQMRYIQPTETVHFEVKLPFWKRSMDVFVSGIALLFLGPVFLVVYLLVRFDSKGPVIYRSKRVGAGYRVFDLLKFRTMRTGADAMIKNMTSLNMYNKADTPTKQAVTDLCEDCRKAGFTSCQRILYLDNEQICEKVYLRTKGEKAAFMKFGNDPRITRIGHFLRNSSLDELPQLINIFRGDMSLVGNRPLPLYEAEKLTSDEYIQRFTGPAGLTGLWQVTKRGKKDMSEEERMQLDIEYAKHFSFQMDMMIILKTFPALLQSENV